MCLRAIRFFARQQGTKENKMKRILCITIAALMTVVVAYAEGDNDPGPIGIGYQGIYHPGSVMNEISLRWAPQPIGGALAIGHMREIARDNNGSDEESVLLQGKGFWTLIDRANSDFYVGGTVGFAYTEEDYGDHDHEWTTWILGGLVGVEWNFQELPEVGFNFEVGYNVAWESEDENHSGSDANEDSIFKGSYVSLGAHYYF
jgi:hypothetical protein